MKTLFLIPILFTSVVSQSISGNLPLIFPIDSNRQITSTGESVKYTWVGTNIGLYRFNKKNGKTNFYNQSNSKLPNNHITSICCTSNGHVYIGTLNGLWLWDDYSFLIINTENSHLPCNYITTIIEDKNRILWIGTYDKGLMKCTGPDIRAYKSHVVNLKNERICKLLFDVPGNLWVRFSNGEFACLQNGDWVERSGNELLECEKSSIVIPPFPMTRKR